MEEKRKLYNKDDKLFAKFKSYAPIVALYVNEILERHPHMEKELIQRIKDVKFSIKDGKKENFSSNGSLFEVDLKYRSYRALKLYTIDDSYDVDRDNPDFSNHFAILEQPYIDKKSDAFTSEKEIVKKVEFFKTLIHELNHFSTMSSFEYYNDFKLKHPKNDGVLHDGEVVYEVNCVGGVPRKIKKLGEEDNVRAYLSGYLLHEGQTELLAHEIFNSKRFATDKEFSKYCGYNLDTSYECMTKIVELQNFLTDDLFYKCYWGDKQKTIEDSFIINEKLNELNAVVNPIFNSFSCFFDKEKNYKDDEIIEQNLKEYFRLFNKNISAYKKLLINQLNEKVKTCKIGDEMLQKISKNLLFIGNLDNWFCEATLPLGEALDNKHKIMSFKIFNEVVREIANEKEKCKDKNR